MNLQPVEPVTDTLLLCCRCGQWSPCRSTLADLHGEPFRAYYCASCASTIPPATLRGAE